MARDPEEDAYQARLALEGHWLAQEAAFERDFREVLLPAPPVEGLIRPHRAWFIMAALQLALRHPEFPESIRVPVEEFARQLQEIVSQTPVLAAAAEAGWHPEQDVPIRDEG